MISIVSVLFFSHGQPYIFFHLVIIMFLLYYILVTEKPFTTVFAVITAPLQLKRHPAQEHNFSSLNLAPCIFLNYFRRRLANYDAHGHSQCYHFRMSKHDSFRNLFSPTTAPLPMVFKRPTSRGPSLAPRGQEVERPELAFIIKRHLN